MNKIISFCKKNKKENWFIILSLVLFFPAGLYLMWRYTSWNSKPKWIITGFFAFFVVVNLAITGINQSISEADEVHAETDSRIATEEDVKQFESDKSALREEREQLESDQSKLEKEREQLESDKLDMEKELEQLESDKSDLEKQIEQLESDIEDDEEEKDEKKESTSDEKSKEEDSNQNIELTDEEYEEILFPYMDGLITVGEDLQGFAKEFDSAGLTIRAKDLMWSSYVGFEMMSERLHSDLEDRIVPERHQAFHQVLIEYNEDMMNFLEDSYNATENNQNPNLIETEVTMDELNTQLNDIVYLYPFK